MSKIVSLIVSHNNRILCLLDKIIPNMSGVKMRFQNCAILRFVINSNGYKINLVYPGELSESERRKVSQKTPYYTTVDSSDRFKPGFIDFPNYDFPIFDYPGANDVFYGNLNLKKEDIKNYEFVFYIVRHGQGEHNQSYNLGIVKVSSTFGLKKDTRVTTSGETQAYNAGLYLYDLLYEYKEDIQNWFSNDLLRSRQTIAEMISGINNASNFEYIPKLLNTKTLILLFSK
jgi:broad specificity phosphatase PhoE